MLVGGQLDEAKDEKVGSGHSSLIGSRIPVCFRQKDPVCIRDCIPGCRFEGEKKVKQFR
jgi:hypothetical protein